MFKTDASFIVLYTADVLAVRDFYLKLGISIQEFAADKVVVEFGSFGLHYILNTTEPFEEYRYIASPGKYGQGVIFYIEVADIYKAKAAVIAAGGTVKADIFENKWGCKELLFEDPDGYKFSLYQ